MAKQKKIILSEEELIDALRKQQKLGIDQLYERYSTALYGVIFRIVQTEEVAEDVMQEAFLKIWNTFGSFDESKGRLFTWIVNIARNLAIDKVRSKDFKNSTKNQDLENTVIQIDTRRNTSYNPDTLGVKDLLDHLRPEQKVILELVYFKGFTHVEVAEELEIPLGTVKTRLRMGVMALRKYFN